MSLHFITTPARETFRPTPQAGSAPARQTAPDDSSPHAHRTSLDEESRTGFGRAGERARGEVCHGCGYGPIIRHLNKLKAHHLTMEFTSPQAGDMAVFRELREDLDIGLDCVDVTPGHVDSAETIVTRVRKALEFLAPERITLNPDCGFAPRLWSHRQPRRNVPETPQ